MSKSGKDKDLNRTVSYGAFKTSCEYNKYEKKKNMQKTHKITFYILAAAVVALIVFLGYWFIQRLI